MDKYSITFTNPKALLVDILLIKKAVATAGGVVIKKHETKHGNWLEIETNDSEKFYEQFGKIHLSKREYQIAMRQI